MSKGQERIQDDSASVVNNISWNLDSWKDVLMQYVLVKYLVVLTMLKQHTSLHLNTIASNLHKYMIVLQAGGNKNKPTLHALEI